MKTDKGPLRYSKAAPPWLEKAMRDVRKRQAERVRKAGEHVCVRTCCGTIDRVTGRGDRILKRPVAVMRFYECKLRGSDMTMNAAHDGRQEKTT